MIFAPLLAVYTGFWLILRPKWAAVRSVVLSGALGIGLAAFFWLPAFYESRWIQLSQITKGHFDFRLHFLGLSELFAPYTALDYSAVNVNLPRSLGWAMLALAVLGLIAAAWGRGLVRRQRLTVLLSALLLLSCLFMMLPASTFLWEHVPLLKLAEFPWRILGIAAVPLALAAGSERRPVQGDIPRAFVRHCRTAWIAVHSHSLILLPLPAPTVRRPERGSGEGYHGLRVADQGVRDDERGRVLALVDDAGTRPTRRWWRITRRTARPTGSTGRRWAAGIEASETGRGYTWNTFRFQADRPFTARFNILWFPGWRWSWTVRPPPPLHPRPRA